VPTPFRPQTHLHSRRESESVAEQLVLPEPDLYRQVLEDSLTAGLPSQVLLPNQAQSALCPAASSAARMLCSPCTPQSPSSHPLPTLEHTAEQASPSAPYRQATGRTGRTGRSLLDVTADESSVVTNAAAKTKTTTAFVRLLVLCPIS
jgi:hypothetical protein